MDKKWFIFGFIFLFLINIVFAVVPNPNVYYTMDNVDISAPTITDMMGTQDATMVGAVTTGEDGILGEAILMDAGTEYLTMSNTLLIGDNLNPSSVCSWVNITSFNAGEYFIISELKQNTGSQLMFFMYESAGTYYLRFGFRGTNTQAQYTFTLSNYLNTWTRFCGVYEGGTKTTAANYNLYINGSLYTTGKSMSTVGGGDTNNYIHKDTGVSSDSDGLIDEFKIWNTNLTSNQILEDFESYFNVPFELTLVDAVGGSLNNFTANITNSTTTTTINTTNGTIYYPKNQIVNISIFNINNSNWIYQNVTNTSINTSADNLEAITDIFDISAPTITINPSNGFNAANFSLENQYDDNLSINITFNDDRDLYGFLINFTYSGTTYYNFTNYTINGTEYNYTYTINTSGWPAATYQVEIQSYDSKTRDRTDPSTEIHNTTTQYNSWYRGNYTKIEPILFEYEEGQIKIKLTDDTTIINMTGELYFNNSLITNTTSTDIGIYWDIYNNISNYPAGTYNYFWIINVTQQDGNLSILNITGELEIFAFGIDNCSSYNYTTLYMNIFKEDWPDEALNATVEIDSEIWISDPSNSRQFNELLEGNSTYRLCLLNPNATFYTDMYIKYTSTDGFTQRYFLVNQTLTNESFNISMYNFNYTTGISDMKITVRNYDTYQYYPNVITKLQRRYPAEGVWRTVQMDESGDFGLVFFNIKEENTDYRILFYDRSNNLLKTTESMKFICDSGVCQLTFTISPYSVIMVAEPVEVIANYNNATKILTVTWTDPDAGTRSVRTLVTKETITGTVDICDQTQSGAAGTVTCNVSAYSGDILLSVITDSLQADSQWINIARQKLATVIDVLEASVWTFGIMVTVAMFGVFVGAVATIISTLIGLIIIYFIGIFNPITLTFIIIAAAVGAAIGAKLRN